MSTVNNTAPDEPGARVYNLSEHRTTAAESSQPVVEGTAQHSPADTGSAGAEQPQDGAHTPQVVTGAAATELDARVRRGELRTIPQTRAGRARVVVVTRGGKAVRRTMREGWTVAQGHASWMRRASDAVTFGHVREQIRLARMQGDSVALAEWTERLNMLKTGRAQRMRELPTTIYAGLRAAAVVTIIAAGLMVMAGLAFQLTPGGWTWGDWWGFVGGVVGVAGVFATIMLHTVLWGAAPAWLFASWREGRRAGIVPRWLVSDTERAEMDSEITPDLVTQALMHVKLPALTKFLKDGGQLEYLIQPREQGGGTYLQVRLPFGVVAANLLDSTKVELLAGNLGRHKHEVWPQRDPAADARVLDLWVADKGTMDKPAPAWPLLETGEFDVFRDRIPFGVTMRQNQIEVGGLQKHWLIGATSKQGKSTVMRLIALCLALDPTIEMKIADLKGDGDWKMFEPRVTTFIEGSTEEDAEATCTMLEWGVAEMERRYQAKADQNIVGPITREISRRKGSGFHPVYLFVDECQVLYGAEHPVGGTKADARAVKAAKRLHDQARAVNIHLMQATQRPDDRTLPVRVREGAHVRGSLNVPNKSTARMILADAVDRGARPEDLRAGADAGTIVMTGEVEDIPAGQAFVIVRTHYVSTKDSYAVIARAMDILKRHGRQVSTSEVEQPAQIDHLANLERALYDEPRARTAVVLARLIEHDPGTYTAMTAQTFAALLVELGVPIRKSNGDSVIRAADITAAITKRDNGSSDEDEDDTADTGSGDREDA
ncbi:hypothetical protein ACIRG5_30230 [Lentzea sp. NPDC102401]|uniref:hypothetical protein n=1 Tax=Lentzea sp. NPDC102401 TaxID=3364128 RepID=UPI0038161322